MTTHVLVEVLADIVSSSIGCSIVVTKANICHKVSKECSHKFQIICSIFYLKKNEPFVQHATQACHHKKVPKHNIHTNAHAPTFAQSHSPTNVINSTAMRLSSASAPTLPFGYSHSYSH